jgi:RNA polymerase sigma-70 factor (ECF subfamily)
MSTKSPSVPVKIAASTTYAAASPMQAETTALMERVKQGDRDAFDVLAVRVRGLAFRVAQSLVGSREDALDLSQEALLKTYRARETFHDGEPFLPWFERILRNTCYSWLRKHGKVRLRSINAPLRGADEESGEWELADDDATSPTDPLVSAERARVFWSAYKKLGVREREVLALRHFKELSYQEIADALDIPIGTVMSRLFYARKRLREGLGDALDDESIGREGWTEV